MLKVILIVDASHFLHRAYHVCKKDFSGKKLVEATLNKVVNMIRRVESDCGEPHALTAIALDHPAKNFRKELFPAYKGRRSEKDAELIEANDRMASYLQEYWHIACSEGFEADDVIATLVEDLSGAVLAGEARLVIASGDQDLHSLVFDGNGGAGVYQLSEKGIVGPKEVRERYGIEPEKIPLFKAIAGDTSDNYSGIPRLGPVAAKRIANQFSSMSQIFDSLDLLLPIERKHFEAVGREHGLLMQRLSTLCHDTVLDIPLEYA